MKTFMKYLFCFFMVCAVGMMAQAADKSVNRKMGYFDNTRTVLLLVTRWTQRKSYPISIFFDIDPVVETQVVVDIYSYKSDEGVRDDQAAYYEREEESSVRNRYIMDEVMKRLWKKFPYRRVPTDVEAKLSGTVHADKDNTPAAVMNK